MSEKRVAPSEKVAKVIEALTSGEKGTWKDRTCWVSWFASAHRR